MNIIHFAKYDPETGVILYTGNMPAVSFDNETHDEYFWFGQADPKYNYIDLKTNRLCTYSAEEINMRDNVPAGFIWKMPERTLIDVRTNDQKAEQVLDAVLASRAAAYPPLADFADALYWQSKGDNSKMDAYLAACDLVKKTFPKPNVA